MAEATAAFAGIGAAALWLVRARARAARSAKQDRAATAAADAASQHLMGVLTSAFTASYIALGHKLGLYQHLSNPSGSPGGGLTSSALAAVAGLDERWVREWLQQQTCAGIVRFLAPGRGGGSDGTFKLAPAYAAALGCRGVGAPRDTIGLFVALPALQRRIADDLPTSFRTGRGMCYDHHGGPIAEGIERAHESFFRGGLVDTVLPACCPALGDAGAALRIADVGCGAGGAAFAMAAAFPRAEVHAFELSQHALDRCRARARAEAGPAAAKDRRTAVAWRAGTPPPAAVAVHDVREPGPDGGTLAAVAARGGAPFDLALSHDVLHDATDPASILREVRAALADDGRYVVFDIKGADGATPREAAARNMGGGAAARAGAALCYGFSLALCMASSLSAAAEGGSGRASRDQAAAAATTIGDARGAGLGTLGLTPTILRGMAEAAGFTRFENRSEEFAAVCPVNSVFVLRP